MFHCDIKFWCNTFSYIWDMWIKKYVPVPDDCKKAQEKKDATYFRSRSRRTRRSNRSRRRRCSPAARTVHRHTPSSGRCNRLLGRVPALVNSSKKTPLADGRAEVYSLEGLGVEIFKRGKRPKKTGVPTLFSSRFCLTHGSGNYNLKTFRPNFSDLPTKQTDCLLCVHM